MRRLSTAVFAALILLTVAATAPPAEAIGFEFEGRVWFPSFDGGGTLPDLGLDVDPELDFDLDGLLQLDSDEVLELRGTFRIVFGFYLRAAYQKMNNSGNQDLTLDDIDLPIPLPPIDFGANVMSALDFEYGRVAFGWRFVAPEKIFSVGAFVEAKGVRGDASIAVDSLLFSDSITEDFEGGAASWGITGEVNPGKQWKIFGEFSQAFGDDEVNMTDFEIGGRYYPTPIFGVGVGYRAMDLDGLIDEVPVDGSWKGVFLTAIVEF